MDKIKIIVVKNPFNPADRTIKERTFIPNEPVYHYVHDALALALPETELSVSINGKVLISDQLKTTIPMPGDCIAVTPVVGKKALALIASIALMAWTGSIIAGHGIGAAIHSSFWRYVTAAAINYVGGALINHFFPPPKPDNSLNEIEYGWGSPQALTGQGHPLAITYGTIRTGGQILAQHVTTDGDKQYLNLLLCGGEGPVDSVSDILINGNPLSNYNDVVADIRLGTNEQAAIPNFNDTFADQLLNYELVAESWSTHTTEGNSGQGLEVTVELPNGLYYITNKGNLANATVQIQAQYRKQGDTDWTAWALKDDGNITAAKNTAVRRSYRIDGLPAARYEVRMQCIYKSGTSTRYSTRIYWTQLSHIIYDDFARPGKVLVGIKALASDQLSGSTPNVTWLQLRNTVNVYNPFTGQYEQKPATNPAWVCYDMIHRCRKLQNTSTGQDEYVVFGISANRIDYQSFLDWAQNCINSSLEFHYQFTDVYKLWDALKIPESVGRGKVILRGTRFSCISDFPAQPVQLFTVGNILKDSFKEDYQGLKDRANCVEITFQNSAKNYEKDIVPIFGDDWDINPVFNPTQISLEGCTTVAQAYRHGKYHLKLNKHLIRTVTWTSEADALACQVGDVILVQHDVPQWGAGGRILGVRLAEGEPARHIITLDRTVAMEPGKSYELLVRLSESDALITKSVVTPAAPVETDEITLTDTFEVNPAVYDVYTFGEIDKSAKPFRVVNITRNTEQTRRITAIEYVDAIYDESGSAPVINYSALIPYGEVDSISVSEETYCEKDGTVISVLHAGWVLPRGKRSSKFAVFYSNDNGQTWLKWGDTDQFEVAINVKSMQTYLVKVCTVNDVGVVSSGVVSVPIYITGKDKPPSDVISLTAVTDPTDSTKIKLSWPAVNDVDLNGYRLMEGSTVLTPTPISDTQYVYTATTSRQHTFYVQAVDNSGNFSLVPAVAIVNAVVEPLTVAGFAITIQETDRSRAVFSWNANSDSDLSYYEIREGTEWNTATVVATQLKATSLPYIFTSEGYKTYLIKAVNVSGHASIIAAAVSLQVIVRPDAPTDLQAQQEPKDRTMLKLSWTASPGKDIAGYEIRRGNDWDSGEYVNFTKDTAYWYALSVSGTYKFMVRAKTVAGYLSNITSISVPVMVETEDVTGFTATQSISNRTLVTLHWDPPISLDISYFEIRKGSSWDTAQIIGQRVTGTSFEIQILDETPHTFFIKAVSVAGKYSQNAVAVEGIFNLNPSPVSNIQISQDANDKSIVNIVWNAQPENDLSYYDVRVGYTWETAEQLPHTKELRCTYRPEATGNIKVMIKAVNTAGFASDEVFTNYYAVLEPATVTGFTAIQNGEYVEIYWDKATESDVVAYEIREGANFDSGSLVASGITLTEYKVRVDNERQYYYHIKAINRSLHYSLNAASAMVAVQNLPPKNIIQTYDEIALQSGTHNNTEFGQSLINWQTIGGKWSDYPNTKFSDAGGQQVLKLRRTEADPTFTRNSIVYKSDGTQVAVNEPRINGGILIEEWTINKYTSNQCWGLSPTSYGGAVVTVTPNQPDPFGGLYAVQIQTSGGTNILKAYYGAYVPANGVATSGQIWIRNRISTPLTVCSNLGGKSTIVLESEGWKKIVWGNIIGNGVTALQHQLVTTTVDDVINCDVAFLQYEEKPYITTWQIGNTGRFSEALTIPTANVLQPQEATIEFWAYVDAQVRDTSKVRRFFSHFNGAGNANRITIQHNNDTNWIFVIANNAGSVYTFSTDHSCTPDGWHHFAMVWNSTRFACFIDGVKRGETTNHISYLPQFLASTFDIGHTAGNNQCNTFIKNLRISNRARTDAEILAAYTNGYGADNDTTYFAPFTNNALSVPLYRNKDSTYTCTRKDMGQVITANITTDFRSSVILRGIGSAKLQMRLSRDNVTWTDWQDFRPAQYTFRYADFRVLLGTTDVTKTPEVNHCTIYIDVPDTQKRGSITIPVGGTTVNYGHTYYTVPVITPTAIGDNKFPQVTAKTNSNFTVKIVDRTGNDVGGQLDWTATGY